MIDSIEFRTFVNKRTSTFTIATGSSSSEENTIVKVVSGDEFGIGNASPSDVTKETRQSIEDFLSKVPKKIVGTDENEPERLHQRLDSIAEGNTAAKAAVDIAIFDLLARRCDEPLWKYLGGERDRMLTDMTIGIASKDITVERAVKHTRSGFKALKI